MIDDNNIQGVYFIGIGGIGMSALALYCIKKGFIVAGYDRSQSNITKTLEKAGCEIIYNDNEFDIPELFRDNKYSEKVLIIITPAISEGNRILTYFKSEGYTVRKRSEVLGDISALTDTIAVAGTHGKTTVSTMTAHLLKQSDIDCSAFLGGISKNYNTNYITGHSRYTVIEADEYDRSFLQLFPLIAVVTAVDADHLDIYGDHDTMIDAYNEFLDKIPKGGTLICNYHIRQRIIRPAGVRFFTYGDNEKADYRYFNIEKKENIYHFNIRTPDSELRNIRYSFPGIVNIENLTAATAVALQCGAGEDEIKEAISSFLGVRRRFDIRINIPGLAYVDDYAHHPEEIRACISSLREYFRGRRITAIFQPHLFSRTRDHAEGFAKILDELDEVILLPVYPAREEPLPGVSSEMIFKKMKLANKRLISLEEIPAAIDVDELDVLVTIGAGDIDKTVEPIETKIIREVGKWRG
ncbi:MAG: UDP-N-acetylmuramate--L-alanine ligase [Bacteroidetes bacterium]|nr:UDP-N-acetylmuramate--L-alanine ligase [Bacteroidota bacterium]